MEEKAILMQIAALAGAINKHKQRQQPPECRKRPFPLVTKQHDGKRRCLPGTDQANVKQIESEKALLTQIAVLAGTINKHKQQKERAKKPTCKYSFTKKRYPSKLDVVRRSWLRPPSMKFKRFRNKTLAQRVSSGRTIKINGVSYKIEGNGHTLQRIENASDSPGDTVPSSVFIRGVTYVKSTNGRSLVRGNSAVKLFASNKKRYSIRTARTKGQKAAAYCLFFNKFGKCKNEGRCRYIHDPSRVAVCRKFLRGACNDPDCRLSHSTANCQQTMPVCYHFLRGVCNNEACPYSHVYVNPNAEVCQAFLKGYCADGAACKLKHTHECQAMLRHGVCSDEKCKLRHRKRRLPPAAAPAPVSAAEEEQQQPLDESPTLEAEAGPILPDFGKMAALPL